MISSPSLSLVLIPVTRPIADQRLVHRDDTAADDRRAGSIDGQRGFLRFR
jgi:hypothetical protein